MTVIIYLNRCTAYGEPRVDMVTRPEWEMLTAWFSSDARSRAANAAAHNADVLVVGTRLLLVSPYGGGYWVDRDGNKTELERKLFEQLYAVTDRTDKAHKVHGNDKTYRRTGLLIEALK